MKLSRNIKMSLGMLNPEKMNLETILKTIENKGIKSVRFEQTDIYGIPRSKTIPARHFREKASNGLNFSLGNLGLDPIGEPVKGTGWCFYILFIYIFAKRIGTKFSH